MSVYEIGEKAVELGAEKIVIVDRWKGGTSRIKFLKVGEGLTQISPCINVRTIKFQREFEAPKKAVRKLFIDGADKEKQMVKRLKESLSDFFQLPIMDAKEAPPEYGTTMRVSTGPSRSIQISFYALAENAEIGPRMRVSHVAWEI
ncbi:MAG: hypothetical protein NWF14_01585 [Candidatus Bathyarchaeota archaeon]|nr:hypothetical protein [Candidatus Bathyarchaeota archaeon]